MNDKQPNPVVLLLYIGRCLLTDGKSEGRLFYQISEDEMRRGELPEEPREIVLNGKGLTMGGNPGIIYRVEQPPDNPAQFYTGTARYAGRWNDSERCAEWQIADQAQGQRLALIREEKKARRRDDVLECLAPIREAYQRARGVQRSLILARAVQYITKG